MTEPRTPKSFVARIWLEDVDDDHATWRGHVRHVQGEEHCYFQTLARLRRFLEKTSGIPLPADTAKTDDADRRRSPPHSAGPNMRSTR